MDNFPIANVREFDPESGAFSAIAPSGTFETGELIRLIGGNFEGAVLPATIWDTEEINDGTTAIVDGELLLSTGTTANGEARVQSVDRAEFVTATFNKGHLAFGFGDFNATDVICDFGMFDPINPIFLGDGVIFRNNSGAPELIRIRGGVEVETVIEANFNGVAMTSNPANVMVKDENIHVYEILYNAGRIDFFQDRRLIHRMTSLSSVAYNTVHLTLGARIRNTNGNTANNTLRTRGFSCSRVGTASAEPDTITVNTNQSTLLKNSPGQLLSVIITETGTAGAEIELHDAVDGAGTPFATVSLTDQIGSLPFNRRLNNGLFIVSSGNAFEVIVNWR